MDEEDDSQPVFGPSNSMGIPCTPETRSPSKTPPPPAIHSSCGPSPSATRKTPTRSSSGSSKAGQLVNLIEQINDNLESVVAEATSQIEEDM